MNKRKVFHPGVFIQDVLEDLDMSQHEFATRLGVSDKHLSEIVNQKASITASFAQKLASMLGTTSDTWINLQTQYDAYKADLEEEVSLKQEAGMLGSLDYAYFVEEDLVEYARPGKEKVRRLRQALGVSRLEYLSEPDLLSYNKTASVHEPRNQVMAQNAWMTIGFQKAKNMENVATFDEKKLRSAIQEIRAFTKESPETFLPKITRRLKESGVRFVFQKYLPKSNVNGAVKWLHDTAVVVLSDRGGYLDTFWFAFFHEMGHVLQKQKRKLIVSNDKRDALEEEADRFARDTLIDSDAYQTFISENEFSRTSIIEFSHSQGIHPGIVVGRLQKEKIIPYSTHNSLRVKF